jgi:hypothetical protein
VLLAENLPLALVAAVVGLLAGELLTPVLANPEIGLLGTPRTAPLTAASMALVIAAAAAVAVAATILPATRGWSVTSTLCCSVISAAYRRHTNRV